jgi:transposase
VAETGADMSRFASSAHLASWAGVCPGHNESGGKRRSGRTRPGNKWLSDALSEAAWAAARSKDTYLAAKFRKVAGPRPDDVRRKKAVVAVAHKLLVIAYAIMATPGETYRELGGDWFAQHDHPERRKARLITQLEALGYDVELTAVA